MSSDFSKNIPTMGDAEIDSHGRFTIPPNVRETLNFKKQVSWFSYGNCLVIIPKQHLFEELSGKIREAVLSESRKVEDIEAKLPHAGEEAFRKRYGNELADTYKELLKRNQDE